MYQESTSPCLDHLMQRINGLCLVPLPVVMIVVVLVLVVIVVLVVILLVEELGTIGRWDPRSRKDLDDWGHFGFQSSLDS